jgi:hypothetical protein
MPLFSLFRTSSRAPVVQPTVNPAAPTQNPSGRSYAADKPAGPSRMPPPRPPVANYASPLLSRAVASVSSQMARLTGGRIGTLSVESALSYLAQGKDLKEWRIAGDLPPASDHLSRQLSAYLNHLHTRSMRDGAWRCDARLAQVLARYVHERLEGPDGPRFAVHFQPMIEQLAELMDNLGDDATRITAGDLRRLLAEKREAPDNRWRARAERDKPQAEEQKRLNEEGLRTLRQKARELQGRDVPVSRKELQSVVRVQRAFKARNKHIKELFATADQEAERRQQPAPEFVVTSYAATQTAPMANRAGQAINDRGMVNFHFRSDDAARQSGMPRTLSVFADQLSEEPAGTIEGEGGYNTIRTAPRDLLLRTSRADGKDAQGPTPADKLGKLRADPVIAAPVQVAPARTWQAAPPTPVAGAPRRGRAVPRAENPTVPAVSIMKNAGVDLLRTVRDPGQAPVAFQEFRNMSQTLKEMHQQGLYHCDIKPQNMTRDGNGLHLIDFDGLVQPAVAIPKKIAKSRFFAAPNTVPRDFKENDEYAFLLSMAIVEKRGETRVEIDSRAPVLTGFIDRHVKPEYRERVKAFVEDGRKGLGPDLHIHDVLIWN